MTNENRFEFAVGAFLIRFGLGLLFFVAGLGKFLKGAAGVSAGIVTMFKETWLPFFMIEPYAYVLPYLELAIGVLLLLGLFRLLALTVGGLLMLSLAFGMLVAGQGDVAAHNLIDVMLFAAALFTSPWDRIKLDSLLFRGKVPHAG